VRTIIVKDQAEWDALPEKFAEETAVHVYSDPQVPLIIKRTPEKAEVSITEKSLVDVRGSATIQYVRDSATIQHVRGSATIQYVGGSATIQHVRGSATIQYVRGSATIQYVGDSATIQYVGDSATIQHVRGSATIQYVGDSATIQYAKENATAIIRSNDVKIEAWHSVTIICQDCKPTIKRHGDGVTIVRTKTFRHSLKSFCEMYGSGTKPLTLYKSVRPDTGCDHYTGTIKYEGIVECPDFDPDKNRQCGGGLHLSPTPHDALRYHEGKVLVCEVAREDIVVFPTDVTKVRCRKVKVIGEWKEKK
jgi:hypothetical protein